MKQNWNKIKVFILLILLSSLFVSYLVSESVTHNPTFSFSILFINLIGLIVFISGKNSNDRLNRQYIRITPLFVFGFIIVYFQFHVDYVIGNIDNSYMRYWVNLEIVPKSLVLSSIGLVSFYLGVLSIPKLRLKKSSASSFTDSPTYLYSFFLLSLLVIYIIMIDPLYIARGYGTFDMGSTARFAGILFELVFIAFLIQHIYNLKFLGKVNMSIFRFIFSFGIIRLFAIVIYYLLVLSSGDRGPVIYMTIGIVSSYVVLTQYKFKLKFLILTLFFGVMLISGLVVLRDSTIDRKQPTLELIKSSLQENNKGYRDLGEVNSISNRTLELGSSVRVLHHSVDNISATNDFFFGQFQFYQLITIVPLGQQLIRNLFDIDETKLTSANYLTYLAGGNGAEEGTSCIADIFLDFGIVGVILIMYLFGKSVRYLELKVFDSMLPSLFILAAFIVLCQYSIYIPRATIAFTLRNIVWVVVIVRFIQILSYKKHIRIKKL